MIIDIDRYNRKRLIILFFNTNKHQYSIRLKNSDTITSSPDRLYNCWELQREDSKPVDGIECVPMHYKDRIIITFIRDESFTKIIVNKKIGQLHSHQNWVKYSKLILNKYGYFNFDTL